VLIPSCFKWLPQNRLHIDIGTNLAEDHGGQVHSRHHTITIFDMSRPKPMMRFYHAYPLGIVLFVLAACSSPDSERGTARLSWDASAGTDLAGYKVYLATAPGAYEAPIATTPTDITTYTVTGLATGTTYFFVVTAFNPDGLESTFSNEVSKHIP
jgi:hypothetical protein